VRPCADYLSDEARHMAVKSGELLDRAAVYDSLGAALADAHLVFGTTRRFGKYREECLLPAQVAELVQGRAVGQRVALVFGREDHGLSTAELDHCHRLLTIPTSETLPSMNLSHAVAVCLYELGKEAARLDERAVGDAMPAAAGAVEAMFSHMRQTLLDIDYLDPQNPDHILRAFRRLFGRGGMSERDVRILQGLWSRIDWLAAECRKAQGHG